MRGRPVHSTIRQNIVEILKVMEKGYGYEIYKAYCDLFPKVSMRSIYYHLHKGTTLDEFRIQRVEVEKGDYSWGPEAEKTYYMLGTAAKAAGNDAVQRYFERKHSNKSL